ncbi:Vomeronasal type-2 receptor 26, partial [Tupaia chinensis]
THYTYMLSFLFTIEEINRNPHLLPNISLGSDIYNAFPSEQNTMENALFLLSGGNQGFSNYNCQTQNQSVAIIVGTASDYSVQIGSLLELYKMPQVTYGPFDPVLSDKEQFPSLYQMAPKDGPVIYGIIWLLLHFGWTWVAVFASSDMKGMQFLQDLKDEMLKKDICVAFTKTLPAATGLYSIIDTHFVIQMQFHYSNAVSSANVYILFGDLGSFVTLHFVEGFYLISGKVWIVGNPYSAQWKLVFSYFSKMLHSFHGSLSFANKKKTIPGFKQFLETLKPYQYAGDFYFTKFWIDIFECSFAGSLCDKIGDCPPNSSLKFWTNFDMMTTSYFSYFIYNAVHAVAQVLHKMLLEKIEVRSPEDADHVILLPWQLHPFLRKSQFTNSEGDYMSFDDKKHMAQYDILNLVKISNVSWMLVKIGEFVSQSPDNQGMAINNETIKWPATFKKYYIQRQSVFMMAKLTISFHKKQRRFVKLKYGIFAFSPDAQQCTPCPAQKYPNSEKNHCHPKIVTFLAFEDSLGITLTSTALFFSVVTVAVLRLFLKHQDTPIVKANNWALSIILLISILLCFLCSLLFIGRPCTATCILRQVTFALVFTVAVSTVLAKTITVILAFKATKPGRTVRWLLVSGASNSVIPICSLIQVIVCAIWLGTFPPFIETDLHSEPRNLIIVCNKGSVIAFYCVLGYLGILALGSFTVAFLARNLPDTFNEAKFLTFSMLVFCSVWVTFLPVYHSTKGKFMVVVEVFSILASSAGLLGCIFAPKCYIILIRPDKNFFKSLKNRGIRHSEISTYKYQ